MAEDAIYHRRFPGDGVLPTTTLDVNRKRYSVVVDPETPLLYVLRNDLRLTGTPFGCGSGECGVCMVLVNGKPAPACDTPLWATEGKDITTVEGLAGPEGLSLLQSAFIREQAAQCGYCLPGILVNATALLQETPFPNESDVRACLERNLCRCGCHPRMIAAVLKAAAGR